MRTFMAVIVFECRQITSPSSPFSKRLQGMLLRLQKYSLDVTYLKGEKMLVADTLSCAHLPEVNTTVNPCFG